MKTRVTMSVLTLILWGWLARSIFAPVTTIAKNTVVVSTVNGGDGAFVAQQALNETAKTANVFYSIGLVVVLVMIWAPVVKKWWETDPIINSAA